jgi:hypothetical protein
MAYRRARRERTSGNGDVTPTKEALQRQMEETRDSLAETVKDIKNTVTEQYESVKETVGGVLNFREQFQEEPLVWSLGALSAGFALGFTAGYAHKEMKGSRKHSEVGAFANSLVQEISTVGNTLLMPTLNLRIKELFGFEFSDLLAEIGSAGKSGGRRTTKTVRAKKSTKATTKRKSKAKRKMTTI